MSDVITFENDIADDGAGNEPGLFDDDDPFNLPPPLPPLSPQRDDDPLNQDGVGDQTTGNSDKKEPNKKRKVNRSPRPKLDEVRLCNDRGIPALRHICDGIKFKGKGHEASDLTLLMQRYEHWAHRLFPKFPFVDVVDQVENLGGKKLVQNCIKRIRRGEEETVEDDDNSDTEIGQKINGSQADGTLSQGDGTPATNNMQTFGVDVEARDKMVILTPELQERIRLNRERALAKRKAAQEKQAQQENTQTNIQIGETEEAVQQSTDNDGIAKDDDATQNHAMENNPIVQTNDIEMEVETTEANDPLPGDGKLESETNADSATPTPIVSANEKQNTVGKDIEMGNTESEGFVTDDVVIFENEDCVSEAESGNIHGPAIVDNDLLNSIKDLPPHKDDSDLVNAQQLEEMSSSSSNVDQSADRGLNDGALHQEVCKETLIEPITGRAPDQNYPGGPQSMDMETEQ